jgi:transcription elongation factor Elf1
MESNWARATKFVTLRCPKCDAMNRPGATIIDVQQGTAVCGVCAHHWKPE